MNVPCWLTAWIAVDLNPVGSKFLGSLLLLLLVVVVLLLILLVLLLGD